MNDLNEWMETLSDDEKEQITILDAYFRTRRPLPERSEITGKSISPEHKTTQDIVDDVQPMRPVSQLVVYKYMVLNGYSTITSADGTLKWAIWRDVEMCGDIE